ncbi:MAG: hypothetical protein VKQ33_04615 [Candidatus Sericytochromatia bacterium]|nr:hypothetical protein [Candidatus Sericytochromatia bacterium]
MRCLASTLAAFACWGNLMAPAGAQAVYHLEKDDREQASVWNKVADRGMAHVKPVQGIYHAMLEQDVNLHAFAWRDGHNTTDGQPTYSVQCSIHRQPRRYTRIPDVDVTHQVSRAAQVRNLEWRIPMVAATYHVFPAHGNPDLDRPLAVMTGRNAQEGFRASVTSLPYRHLTIRAFVRHEGVEDGRPHDFQRTYTFKTPTIDVVDGRHEPYEMYHWFW